MIRILFFGSSSFAIPVLERLHGLEGVLVVGVVAKKESPMPARAKELGLPVFTPEKFNEVIEELKNLKPDVGVVAAYGKILPQSVLEIPPHGFLNVHPSLLPRHRGPSPVQATIASGDAEAGITIIKLDEAMDHGPVVAQERVALRGDEWYDELKDTLFDRGANLICRVIKDYVAGTTTLVPQDHTRATICHELTREDGRINWSAMSAETIWRRLRAYTPWPGIWTTWKRGDKVMRLKVLNAVVARGFIPYTPLTAGGVQDPALHVYCLNGFIQITKLQPEAGKPMTAAQFVNGYRDVVGAVFT